MRKKFLAMLLTAVLAVGLLPTAAFAAAGSTEGTKIPSGTCGENLFWELADGVLTIGGTGAMYNYYAFDLPPWSGYSETITTVVVESGVTSIGSCAFYHCANMTSAIIGEGVDSIGISAFTSCTSLTNVVLPASLGTMSEGEFSTCTSLTDVYYGGSEADWGWIQEYTPGLGYGSMFADGGQKDVGLGNVKVHYNSTGPEPTESETPAITFDDVPADEWYAAAVSWGVENGYVLGHGDGTFAPKETCTHIQILTFLWRAAGWDESAPQAPVDMDPNVPQYQLAANWAYDKDMIDGDFDPEAPCTRADAVNYIWQAFGREDAPAGGFTDVDAGAPYAKAVDWAAANGITVGDDAELKTFNPTKVCDRGEIVTFLHRAYVEAVRVK